jgi:hypothetical protein
VSYLFILRPTANQSLFREASQPATRLECQQYQFEITRRQFSTKNGISSYARNKKFLIKLLALLQKCLLAVEFGVSQVQPICACLKTLLIPVLLMIISLWI